MGAVRLKKIAEAIGEFVASGSFGVFVLSMAAAWALAMTLTLVWPQNFTVVSSFFASFRVWCFGYDPATGHFDITRVAMIVLDPVFFAAVVFFVWRAQVAETLRRNPRVVVYAFMVSTAIVSLILGGLSRAATANSAPALIRGYESAPAFALTDQGGTAYGLRKGRVTVVSAFYSHCAHTCPLIVKQMKDALSKANVDVSKLDIALITLDPERDNVERLAEKAEGLNLAHNWYLLTGDAKTVNSVLDRYQVARVREKDGNISHSNVFYVIDKFGRIAFRIGLGGEQETWLRQAIELLTEEGGE